MALTPILMIVLVFTVSYSSESAFGQTANEIDIASGAGANANADCVTTNSCFYPNPLTVAPGTTVTWRNTDTTTHTICSGKSTDEQCGTVFEDDALKTGQIFQFTFANAGTYDYLCSVHPWMAGTIIVGSSTTLQSNAITVTTDRVSYNMGDSIIVSGMVNQLSSINSQQPVIIQTYNGKNEFVRTDQVIPTPDGQYSITIHPNGLWQNTGTYTIKVKYDLSTTLSTTTFYFNSGIAQTPIPSPVQNIQNEIDIASGAGANANADCVSGDNCFTPNPMDVPIGSTVTWKNTDTVSHTITSGKPSDNDMGSLFDSNLIKPSQTFQFTFANAGTYNYFCTVHPWMVGQVIVGGITSIPPTQPLTSTPSNNQATTSESSMFEGSGIVTKDTYVNKLYDLSIIPPSNWKIVENVKLLGGGAGLVGFYANGNYVDYTPNFIIDYKDLGTSLGDLRSLSDNDYLNAIIQGILSNTSDTQAKILNKNIQSFSDGRKVTIDLVWTAKMDDGSYTQLEKEIVIFIFNTGKEYSILFNAKPNDFDQTIGEFRNSLATLYVGTILSENNISSQQPSQTLPQSNSQSTFITDFSNYGLEKGEWVKYNLGINVVAQNQYIELFMKNTLLKGITSSLAQNDNLQINSIDDIEWFKVAISDISSTHLSTSAELKIKGEPVITSEGNGLQSDGLFRFAIPTTTKIDDSFSSDNNGATIPSKMIVTRIINEQIGSNHVQAYELFGQMNTVNPNGTASEVNVTSHYEKQTGMLLDTHLDARYGSPLLGVVDVHFNISAQDLSLTGNELPSTVITNPTQQDIQNINQAKANQTIAAEVNIGTSQSSTTSIDNNVSVQTTSNTPDSLNVNVSAPSQTSPKVIVFNLNATTINVSNLKDLGVMYDGKPILPAPNMDAILHAKSTDNPSFAIVVTQSGVQVLVLVPHFSTHSITIMNMSKIIPAVPEFPLSILTLIIATFSIILIPRLKRII